MLWFSNLKICEVKISLIIISPLKYFSDQTINLPNVQFICRMEVEFTFSYGNFGYGYSHQVGSPFKNYCTTALGHL